MRDEEVYMQLGERESRKPRAAIEPRSHKGQMELRVKECIGCHQIKPANEFYESQFSDGLRASCKACVINRQASIRSTWSEHGRAKQRAWTADHAIRHPLAGKARGANRRAIQTGALGTVTEVELVQLFEKNGWRCWICGDEATEPDHFIPINKAAGGTNDISNIRPACSDCNYKRSRKRLDEATALREAALLRQLKELLRKVE
jgi:5-methylcytosine-specific restriction endonuclease McrA